MVKKLFKLSHHSLIYLFCFVISDCLEARARSASSVEQGMMIMRRSSSDPSAKVLNSSAATVQPSGTEVQAPISHHVDFNANRQLWFIFIKYKEQD